MRIKTEFNLYSARFIYAMVIKIEGFRLEGRKGLLVSWR